MNTKGTRFLAVLAVLVMAFAAFAVVMPGSQDSDAAISVENPVDITADTILKDPKKVNSTILDGITAVYISEDLNVKVEALGSAVTFYVQNGKSLQLSMTSAYDANTITIYTVTGDPSQKLAITDTKVVATGSTGKQTFYYDAAEVKVSTTIDGASFSQTVSKITAQAEFSADHVFSVAPTLGAEVLIANGQSVASAAEITGYTAYGIRVTDADATDGIYKYYGKGDSVSSVTLADGDSVSIIKGSITVKYGSSSIKASSVAATTASPITITIGTDLAISGEQTAGEITLTGDIDATYQIDDGATSTIAANTTVVGTITLDGKLIIKSKLVDASDLTIASTANANSGILVPQQKELWILDATDEEGKRWTINVTFDSSWNGFVDTTAITTSGRLDSQVTTATILPQQTFTADVNTNIYGDMLVQGILIINEGVTLTIESYSSTNVPTYPQILMQGSFAKIINNGKIVVKTVLDPTDAATAGEAVVKPAIQVNGGIFENNGTITLDSKKNQYSYGLVVGGTMKNNHKTETGTAGVYEYAYQGLDSVVTTPFKFINNGTITVGQNDAVFLNGVTNNGTIRVNGQIFGFTTFDSENPVFSIKDNSEVVLQGKVVGKIAVNLIKTDAKFNIQAAQFDYDGDAEIYVMNTGIYSTGYAAGATVAKVAQVSNSAPTVPKTFSVRGLVFTGAADSDTNKTPAIAVEGMSVSTDPKNDNNYVDLTITGRTLVTGTFSVPKGVALTMSDATTKISGNMTVMTGASLAMNNITVTGKLVDNTATSISAYVAALVSNSGVNTYTTLTQAIQVAKDANVSSITIAGTSSSSVVVDEDFEIPAGITVSGDYLKIGKSTAAVKAVVPLEASLSVSEVEIVNGELYTPEKGLITGQVYAHVVDEGDEAITYMSLEYAMSKVNNGTIVLQNDFKKSSGTLTIPAGITIDAFLSDNDHAFNLVATDLVIDGTLMIDNLHFIAETDDDKSITVNGYLKDEGENGDEVVDKWFTPIGVSYIEHQTIDEDEIAFFVITSLANLQPAVTASEDGKVTVQGEAKLGDVTIKGTEDKIAEVTFEEDISAGTITIENTHLVAQQGKKVNATVADVDGAIILSGAYVSSRTMEIYSEGNGVYITGGVTDSTDATYSITFLGKTGMEDAAIGWGNYDTTNGTPGTTTDDISMIYPLITYNGTTTVIGKNTIEDDVHDDVADQSYDTISIIGSLIVDNGAKLEIMADMDITGSLIANEKTATSSAGQISVVAGDAYVGATQESIYDRDAAKGAYSDKSMNTIAGGKYGDYLKSTANGAVMSGSIEFDSAASFITVMAGSTVDEDIVSDMKSLPIFVDGELWLTVYGTNQLFSMDGLKAPVEDSQVDKIMDPNGNSIADYSQSRGVIYNCPAFMLDKYEYIGVSVNYDIYTVYIKTDASVKAVYIDDILMQVSQNANTFQLANLEAGSHKVTVEPVSGYSADKVYLYKDDGTKLSGLTFKLSDEECVKDTTYAMYNLAGTEIIPEPTPEPEKESEWTITTILLLVLVILIAIMAVIVAMRLMRS